MASKLKRGRDKDTDAMHAFKPGKFGFGLGIKVAMLRGSSFKPRKFVRRLDPTVALPMLTWLPGACLTPFNILNSF
jgi:hypothetical protein